MFLNLSNHPSAAWGPAQRAAAEALAPGPLHDLPFPEVDPSWDTPEVVSFAQTLATQILARNPTAAMVQGEHTLTLALVAALEKEGLPCFAATSRRVSTQTILEDGSTQKVVHFEFVRFRLYAVHSGYPAQSSGASL